MAHIFGRNLPRKKTLVYALTNLYGINITSAKHICSQVGVTETCKVHQIKDYTLSKIARILTSDYTFEGKLKKEIQYNIKRQLQLRTFKGTRFFYGLPVRGQRTKTNASTQKRLKHRYVISK